LQGAGKIQIENRWELNSLFAQTYSILQVGRILAGVNSIDSVKEIAEELGAKSVLIISDQGVSKAGLLKRPVDILSEAGIHTLVLDTVPAEPEVNQVSEVCRKAAGLDCQLIVGIGGGSVMDVAKLAAVILRNKLSMEELLKGIAIPCRGIPTVMVPTTAGTGAEATPNAIVLVPEDEMKVGIVSSKMVPDFAILDPILTVGLPPAITASTGMDALTHAIECYTSKKANPLSDTYALRAVSLLSRSIRRAYRDGNDIEARHDMLLGAMFGGMAIATSSTTAVHALAYPLGGKYRIPHGLSNAILLPYVMAFNMDAAEDRFADIAMAMGVDKGCRSKREAAQAMIANLYSLIKDMNLQVNFAEKGISDADVDGMVEAASKVTRLLNNNPKPMTKSDMRGIYLQLLKENGVKSHGN
jgi:alcohol dehydrogenase class IV